MLLMSFRMRASSALTTNVFAWCEESAISAVSLSRVELNSSTFCRMDLNCAISCGKSATDSTSVSCSAAHTSCSTSPASSMSSVFTCSVPSPSEVAWMSSGRPSRSETNACSSFASLDESSSMLKVELSHSRMRRMFCFTGTAKRTPATTPCAWLASTGTNMAKRGRLYVSSNTWKVGAARPPTNALIDSSAATSFIGRSGTRSFALGSRWCTAKLSPSNTRSPKTTAALMRASLEDSSVR
mmetsp:Transcript_26870/g.66527  ORF Transcript_26870/g.66527 Transcript_26870/m.66527 type:complete len:241 (+) Transcript_26870:735-1457(+)